MTSDAQHVGGEIDAHRAAAAGHEVRRDLPWAAAKVEDQRGRLEHVDSALEYRAVDETLPEIIAESTDVAIRDVLINMPNCAGVEAHSK